MDMSQYRELFFSETREHLNKLNAQVVDLEQNPGDRVTIDALFREAHSIKGMAATMGFEQTASLAHHLEDLLDVCRTSGSVPPATVDTLLAGLDLLEALLDDLAANRPERSISGFLNRTPADAIPDHAEPLLAVASDEETGDEEAGDEDLPLLAVEIAEDATEEQDGSEVANDAAEATGQAPGRSEGLDVFQLLIDLDEGTPAPAARCMLILRELDKVGELLANRPSADELRSGAPCQQLQAWLRTTLAREHLAETVQRLSGVARVRFIADRRREERRSRDDGRTIRVRTDLLDQFINLTGELITQRHRLTTASSGEDRRELNLALEQTGRLIDDLHHHVLQARLMPLESITGRLPRIVRDLSRKTGKRVALKLSGTDVGIDRAVLEELADPLVHLVRNAIDHGIASAGAVSVSARREKDRVLVEVADDGQGMDHEQLRGRAVERGLLSAEQAAALSERDALMLVCQPGFSTADQVTETSGRGVGMDIVKAAVVNLGGELDIVSTPGRGSRFQLRLPLSVAIIRILLVAVGRQVLAFPLTRVLRALDLPADEVERHGRRASFRFEEEEVPLVSLARALDLPEPPATDVVWTILTEVRGRRIGLQVDRLLGHRKAYVKTLGLPLNRLAGVAGGTVEGDGRVVFIIDPQGLLEGRQELVAG